MIFPKKKLPSTEKINKHNINRVNAFNIAVTDSVIVDINACRPLFLPASLTIRVIRSILINLAI